MKSVNQCIHENASSIICLNIESLQYCISILSHQGRPTRSDSGETGADMTLNRIISAGWFATHDGGSGTSTLTISQLENAVQSEPIYEASQYDMFLGTTGM